MYRCCNATHSSTLGSGESHDSRLASISTRARRPRAAILSGGSLLRKIKHVKGFAIS